MQSCKRCYRRCNKWKPNKKNLCVRAIKISRLNGLKETVKPETPCWLRLFWLAVFIICLSYGVSHGVKAVKEHFRRPILHTFHDGGVAIDKTPFPGMTVSSPYMLQRETLHTAHMIYTNLLFEDNPTTMMDGIEWDVSEASKLIHTIDHICESSRSYGRSFGKLRKRKVFNLPKYEDWVIEQNTTLVDNPMDRSFRDKVFPLLKKGLTNCSETVKFCLWRGSQNKSCDELFSPVQTDVGFGCAFNKIPDSILRSDTGLKRILYEHGRLFKDEVDLWKEWNIDKHPFLEKDGDIEKEADIGTIPYSQKVAGKNKGLSFTLKYDTNDDDIACPVFDSIGKMVTFHSPIDEPTVLTQGINIPPGREVFIKLFPEVTIADPRIRDLHVDVRKCYFQDENPLTNYKRYTQGNCRKECLAQKIKNSCKCHQLSATVGNNETICGPLKQECVQREIEKLDAMGYEKACEEPKCYAPCTEITYRTEVTSSELIDDLDVLNDSAPITHFSIVHVYMSTDSIVSHERTLHQDYSELFGILGGIIGLTNGIDIVGIFYIFSSILILLLAPYKVLKRLFRTCYKKLCSILPFKKINKPKQELGRLPTLNARVKFIRVRPRRNSDKHSNVRVAPHIAIDIE